MPCPVCIILQRGSRDPFRRQENYQRSYISCISCNNKEKTLTICTGILKGTNIMTKTIERQAGGLQAEILLTHRSLRIEQAVS